MKKIVWFLFVVFSFLSCSNDEEKLPDAPILQIQSNPIPDTDGSYTIRKPMTFKCSVTAAGYINSITCSIDSPTIPDYLKTRGIDPAYFDLADPSISSNERELLKENGIACGDEVYMQQAYYLDLSSVLPKILEIQNGNFIHKFHVEVTDFYGRSVVADLVVNQYKQGEVEIKVLP